MNTSKTTRTLEVAVATAAAGAVLLGGGAAHADGAVGQVSGAHVTCYGNPHYPGHNEVVVQPPAMSSSAATHSQRVAYQAVLYRWDGAGFVRDRVGPTVEGSASDTLRAVRWDDRGGASSWFSTPGSGYYTVYLRYTWFPDNQSAGGTSGAWAQVYEQGRASYCHF